MKKMYSYNRPSSGYNNGLIFMGLTILLSLVGLIAIYSSSSIFALEKFGSASYFVKKQAIGLLLAVGACSLTALTPLYLIRAFSPLLFAASAILTLLTLIPQLSVAMHGSARWLSCGYFVFQPSELLKICFVLYSAHLLARREHALRAGNMKTFFIIIALAISSSLILLKQPDFGMATILMITALFLLFIMQVNTTYLIVTFGSLIPIALVLIAFKPYRLKRIITFLNPWQDPKGSGFQIIQSLIAIGSGGWWGLGIGQSKQKFFYLPMQHTDFIFSIIVEEVGFIGAIILIGLYLIFLYYGIKVAYSQPDTFATIFCLGFIILITLQILIHLGVTTGLVPPKGVGLPLISYGKSSLISIYIMVGLMINSCLKNK